MDTMKPNEIYERLADALGRLPNGFPRTPSNVEIPLLRKIFSPEDASIAAQLTRDPEGVDTIAERAGASKNRAAACLKSMAERGLVWLGDRAGKPAFRLAPFIVGIYEAQSDNMDYEMAHLVEHYMADGGAAGIMKPVPAIHRVIPAQSAVKSEWILPYDDVRNILEQAKTFRVTSCVCRKQRDQLGRKCDFPVRMCLVYFFSPLPSAQDAISRQQALAILDEAEEIGLVHTVSNVQTKSLFARDIGYICNCCGCCCGILRGITEWGVENSVAQANYYAVIDPKRCIACGLCAKRCQVKAISNQGGAFAVDRQRCIGCGLCASRCPQNAAALRRKPDSQLVNPPLDLAAWEQQRLRNRR